MNYIKDNIELFDCFESVYLFGSFIKNQRHANDIDVLFIYKSIGDIDENRLKEIQLFFENYYHLPVDFTILSVRELFETGFLRKVKTYLKIK